MPMAPYWVGSSPHPRGAPNSDGSNGVNYRIIPASAGSTGAAVGVQALVKDHPRIRGEHHPMTLYKSSSSGSSPHPRGALVLRAGRDGALRIIPASAGSTLAHAIVLVD